MDLRKMEVEGDVITQKLYKLEYCVTGQNDRQHRIWGLRCLDMIWMARFQYRVIRAERGWTLRVFTV